MRKRLLVWLSVFMAITSVGWLHAEGGEPTSVKDVSELKSAIEDSSVSSIQLAAGEYMLTAPFTITRKLTIEGPAIGTSAVIKTTNDGNALLIEALANDVTLKNLSFEGAEAATLEKKNSIAISVDPNKFTGKLTLDHVTISNYFFGINSGAVTASKQAPKNSMLIGNSHFIKCYHKAVYTENSEIAIQNSVFEDCATVNKSQSGWFTLVAVDINLKYGTYNQTEVTGCTFKQNGSDAVTPPTGSFPDAIAYSVALGVKARNDGGYATNPATLEKVVITGNTFTRNSLGVQLGEPQTKATNVLTGVTMSDNTFTGNYNDIVNSSTFTPIASEVKNVKGLLDAVDNAAAGATIKMAANTYELNATLFIKKDMTLMGAGKTTILKPTNEFPKNPSGDGGNKYLITVTGDKVTPVVTLVTLKDFLIDGQQASGNKDNYKGGLNIVATTASLSGITSQNNKNGAGLVVNGASVSVSDFHTSGNGWGGVNIGNNVSSNKLKFTFDDKSSFDEPNQIYSEISGDASIVEAPADWRNYVTNGVRVWSNASLESTAVDAEELKAKIAIAQPGQVVTLTGTEYAFNEALTIKSESLTLKSTEGKNAKLTFANSGLIVDADNVKLIGLDVTATTGNALIVNTDKKGMSVEKGSYINVVEGKQGEGAIRFEGDNGDIKVSEATLKGGIHVLGYAGGDLAGITKNTIKIEGTPNSPLCGIIVAGAAEKVSAIKFPALALYKQQAAITMPATGAQCDVLYQNTGASPWAAVEGVATPGTAAELSAMAAFDNQLTILLEAKAYEFSSRLDVTKSVKLIGSISGQDTTSIIAKDWKTDGGDKNKNTLIEITAANVALSNLNIKNSQRNGINVYNVTGITLDNVTIQKSEAAALVVNGSKVAATNFHTSGSGWGYGVNVDKGSGVEADPVFTIGADCSFGEAIAIKSDLEAAPDGYVVGSGWVKMKKTVEDKKFTVWANAASSGINLAITSVPATVVWGAKELPLVANVESATFGISEGSDVVEIVTGDDSKKSLKILKPGKATLTLTANDITIQQAVTVLKKTLTVTGITATERAYDRGTEVALVTDDITVNGLVGEDKNVISGFSGKRTSANAGEAVPVEVTATFAEGKADYYTLAPITGVTVKVKKVDLTLTTAALEAINYGATLPVFDIVRDNLSFVEGDSFEDLTGELKFDCPVTKTTLAGTYKVTPFGYTSPNYNIQYKSADLEVNAIAPTAEITNVKVNAVGSNASVTVSGRILNNGGTATEQLTAKLEAKTGNSTTKTVDNIEIVNGTFTVDVTGLSGATYTIDLTIKASESLSSTAVSSSELALAAKMQNIRFSSELNRLTYGATADLKAEGYQSGAKVVYTTDKPEVLAFNEDFTGVVAKGAGTAVITATATLDEYVTAVAKQTVTVEPKIVTVKATASDKTYNGQTDATVDYKASGILPEDAAVLLNASGMKAAFTDKNADEKVKTVILSGTCSLDGNEKGNYTLVQPTNPTATINPATTISAITVSNVKRKYNETSLHYDLSANELIGEALTDAGLYIGTISVKETEEGTYTLNTTNVKFRNYAYVGKITTGSIEIKKGVPSVVTFNKEGENGVAGKIVDYAGWSADELELEIEAGKDNEAGTSRAVCTYPGGTVTGNAVTTAATAPTLNIQLADIKEEVPVTPATANRLMTRANTTVSMSYGEVKKLTVGGGEFTFETLNPAVLTIDEKQQIMATGAGTGVILVTAKSGNGVAQITIPVIPATLTVEATGFNRTYNGQTTADVALTLQEDNINAATLDLTGVTFNYASKDVQNNLAIYPSKEIVLTGENAANYKLEAFVLEGKITPRELTLTSQISKYYDGSNTMTLKEYSADGLLADEAAPELTVTIADGKVGKEKTVSALKVASANYSLKNEPSSVKANIVKSKLLAEIPTKATSPTDVINNIGYTVYETGATIAKGSAVAKAIGKSYIKVTGSNPFNVTDVANEDCELVLSSNTIGKTSTPPVTPPDEPEDVAVSSVELDITAKSLQRTGSFVLTATLNKGGEAPTKKAITWKSSDETIAKVESTGDFTAKVTALAVGDATITVTTEDGAKTATCEVTVDFATGLEEAIANTRVYAKEGSICIEPQMPMNVMVVSMAGNTIYKNVIHCTTYIPISASGIYIIKLGQGNDAKVHKVKVD